MGGRENPEVLDFVKYNTLDSESLIAARNLPMSLRNVKGERVSRGKTV